jgi:hypothetical protein
MLLNEMQRQREEYPEDRFTSGEDCLTRTNGGMKDLAGSAGTVLRDRPQAAVSRMTARRLIRPCRLTRTGRVLRAAGARAAGSRGSARYDLPSEAPARHTACAAVPATT